MARTIVWKTLLASLLLIALVAVGGSVSVSRVSAQGPTPDDPALTNKMLEIAKGLYCPVCVGTPLDVCQTQACEQWRNLIIEKLKAGDSPEKIRQYFIDQYGDKVLGAPPPEGVNLFAYIVPIAIFLLLAVLLLWRRRSAPAPRAAPALEPSVSPEFAERIRRELELRERD